MIRRPLRIGTRGSRLAMVQVDLAVTDLLKAHPEFTGAIEIVQIDSAGDLNRKKALEDIGGRGVFTNDIDQALIDDRIDIAVHSVKDLPARCPGGLSLAATLDREDPREALVSSVHDSFAALPHNAVMGSASYRRMSFLRHMRPGVKFALLRGNVEERVAALSDGSLDGTILAVAGLKRLGLHRHIKHIFEPSEFPPDPGQGAIGLVCRSDDFTVRRILSGANHEPTFACVSTERSMLAALGLNCRYPAGALAQISGNQSLCLSGALISEDGSTVVSVKEAGQPQSAEHIGETVAYRLLTAARRELAA